MRDVSLVLVYEPSCVDEDVGLARRTLGVSFSLKSSNVMVGDCLVELDKMLE
jgi:hypothetical protein